MFTQVRTQGLDLGSAFERHLAGRVRTALGPFAARVGLVTASFSDVNGPRGGADMHCAVSVELVPTGSVRTEATHSDLVAALTKALARARRSLSRKSSERRRQ